MKNNAAKSLIYLLDKLIYGRPRSEINKLKHLDDISLDQLLQEITYWTGELILNKEESPNRSSIQSKFWKIVDENMSSDIETLVDLGSGVKPYNRLNPQVHLCVERFEPYIEYLQDKFKKTEIIIIKEDCLEFLKMQPNSSINTIVCLDLIEHLEREAGLELIAEIERTCSNQALVFTPNGFMQNHCNDDGAHFWGWKNSLQNHLSGYEPVDFPNWKIIQSNDYYLDKNYSKGAFAAVFKKQDEVKSTQSKKIVIVVDYSCLSDTKDWNSKLSYIENVCKVKKIQGMFVLPIQFAPFSHAIHPNIRLPQDLVYMSSNMDLNIPRLKEFHIINSKLVNLDSLIKSQSTINVVLTSNGLSGLVEMFRASNAPILQDALEVETFFKNL
jgi:hypothetical protein